MKLNYAPQVGLRRRKPDHHRQRWAFWGGVALTIAFEIILMAKTWPEFHPEMHWPWEAADASSDSEATGD